MHYKSFCPSQDSGKKSPKVCILQVGDDVTILVATGKYAMLGGIDQHTHLGMEFMGTETIDDFFSGQAATLAGGTTMHIDFVIPVNGSLSAGFKAYTKKAQRSCMDYGFHMAITKWDEVVARDMKIMVREKGQRVVGEPVVSGQVLDDSWLWDNDFTTAAKQELAYLSVTRVFHCSRYVMSPPIRKLGHGKALQAALSTRTLQLVGTDHCTFNSTQKALDIDDFRKIPNGVNVDHLEFSVIEERMHLIWDTMVESGQISVTNCASNEY
ncbi:hypothetical protein IFM89_026720 [Coptis chinensis]|uniref:Dihydropyrimidinase n=1 Tax=Coptis chinensis TaxID=261450 RepID=A0A835LFW2_9MAGN|nr:hypothetical protein IFM89_026720 [Coptis chinensis]